MAKTLSATYKSPDAARNAREDLLGMGYPSEKVFHQEGSLEVKLLTPSDTERQAREILGRHDPEEIRETEVSDT